MALEKTAAVVIGSFPLGETDRVVTFFSRAFGKVRGVARGARRIRSRFGAALELLTLGQLVFFDNGRSELVVVDHFDIVRPFTSVRERLERLGQAAWMAECVARLTAERDPNAALYGLLVRALESLEAGAPPGRVAAAFGVRAIDALGHRLRTDACIACGRRGLDHGPLALDVDGGGVLCSACARAVEGAVPIGPPTIAALRRVRSSAWHEATRTPLGRAETELRTVLEAHVARLGGHVPRAARFIREIERFSPTPGGSR